MNTDRIPTRAGGSRGTDGAARIDAGPAAMASAIPSAEEPSFVLVLHGRWPDAQDVPPEETERRAEEYWSWASALSEDEILVAAGDLRWEPGERLGAGGVAVTVAADEVGSPDFVVGMYAVRAGSYEDAAAIAAECPHLRYGGSVSIRQVGSGFVTGRDRGDWVSGGVEGDDAVP